MKNYILIALFVLTQVLLADPITVNNVTYGRLGSLWNINVPYKGFKEVEIKTKLDQLYTNQTHPLDWQPHLDKIAEKTGKTIEVFFYISGKPEDVAKEVAAHPNSSWVWTEGLTDPGVKTASIILKKASLGRVILWSDQKAVAQFRCSSSEDPAKWPELKIHILRTIPKEEIERTKIQGIIVDMRKSNKHKSVMPWPRWLEGEGFYIHGGDVSGFSDGCIRLASTLDKIFHDTLPPGSMVKICQE